MAFDPQMAARAIAQAHIDRSQFANLSGALAPPTISDAYAAQEALADLWKTERGAVAGLKIATTTKVMQELMGIDHPCGGMIFANRIFPSGASVSLGAFCHVVIECELAVRLSQTLEDIGRPYTRDDVRGAVANVLAALELIEDRNAVYKTTDARTLIADNAWNGGIVIGGERTVPNGFELDALAGRATVNGGERREGACDDPMGALAWLANLAVERGRPLQADMIVITGSLIQTFQAGPGDHVAFEIDGIGSVEMTMVA